MAATSAADYPHLGLDPTPGDTWKVSDVARTLRRTSDALGEIRSVLHGAADGEWRGEAAIAFRDLLDDELRPKIDVTESAFSQAYRHIDTWATDLADFQRRARQLEEQARRAQEDLDAAQAALAALPADPGPGAQPPEDESERSQREADAAARRIHAGRASTASTGVQQARDDAVLLREEYEVRAGQITDLLAGAVDIAPAEPGWFESAVDAVRNALGTLSDLIADLSDAVLEFLHKIAPLLEFVSELTGLLSTILGLLAFVPGLNWLAAPALALAAISFVTGYLADAGASGSWLEPMTTAEFWVGAGSLAIGFGGARLGTHLTAAARTSGNTRMVPQLLIGGTREVPYGLFSMMAGKVTTMETTELVLRTVSLRGVYTGLVETSVKAGDTVGFGRGLFTGDSYPRSITNDPAVVR